MSTFAVVYIYAEGSDDKRDEHRPAHRAFLHQLHTDGKLRASGPFDDDAAAGALLLMECASAAEVGELLDGDPFHEVGAIAERTVRSWQVVVGGTA